MSDVEVAYSVILYKQVIYLFLKDKFDSMLFQLNFKCIFRYYSDLVLCMSEVYARLKGYIKLLHFKEY